MLLPIPIGYFVSLILIISGVLNCMQLMTNRPENLKGAALLNGLVEAGWPIIAASVILLLIQINRQLEKLRLEPANHDLPRPVVKLKKKKVEAEVKTAAPPTQPQIAAPIQPVVRQHAGIPAQKPIYPNSPIPGGGRVPQPAAAMPAAPVTPAVPTAIPTASTPLPPRPEHVPSTRSAKRAPNAEEAGKLNFFKVD